MVACGTEPLCPECPGRNRLSEATRASSPPGCDRDTRGRCQGRSPEQIDVAGGSRCPVEGEDYFMRIIFRERICPAATSR